MLFVALLMLLTLIAALPQRLGLPLLPSWRARMRLALSLALLLIGVDHWLTPARYLAMMPPYLPLRSLWCCSPAPARSPAPSV